MKKIFFLLFASLILFSCSEDKILNDGSDLSLGGYARFENEVVQTADFNNGNGSVSFSVSDANDNAVKYRIYKIGAKIQGQTYSPVSSNYTYTTFPASVSLTLEELAQLFGLVKEDLYYGDSFTFFAEITTEDGRVFQGEIPSTTGVPGLNTTSTDLLNSTFGYKQAMQFTVTVACPNYTQADMIGTYTIENDAFGFGLGGYTFECIAGSNENELIFVDWTNEGKDLVVTIDPAAQVATVAKQEAWYHPTYGWASVAGSGLVFSCIGTINLSLTHTVAAGSFGSFGISLVKAP